MERKQFVVIALLLLIGFFLFYVPVSKLALSGADRARSTLMQMQATSALSQTATHTITTPHTYSIATTRTTITPTFLQTSGTNIVDANGNAIILRGINYGGYECVSMMSDLHVEADYSKFASIGFNVVRLPIGWMWFEPQPGAFDQSYLDIINRDVHWAHKYGLYIILDMHQVDWAPKFPEPNGNAGCGSPNWTVTQYPSTTAGMQAAIQNFWSNDTLQTHYADTWTKLAAVYSNNATIAGYDIMNEPSTFNGDYSSVQSFYLKVIQSIRSVDTNHIMFLEPVNGNIQTAFAVGQAVWSPHLYPVSSMAYSGDQFWEEQLNEQFVQDYNQIVLGLKMPMWIGEYGAYPSALTPYMSDASANLWLQNAISLFNQYDVGSAWWPYKAFQPTNQIPPPIINQFHH